jgi:hypothetical protein
VVVNDLSNARASSACDGGAWSLGGHLCANGSRMKSTRPIGDKQRNIKCKLKVNYYCWLCGGCYPYISVGYQRTVRTEMVFSSEAERIRWLSDENATDPIEPVCASKMPQTFLSVNPGHERWCRVRQPPFTP